MPSADTLVNRDFPSRAQMPTVEQLADVLADMLYSADDALDILRRPGVDERLVSMRPRIQQMYDEVNSLMKELVD